MTRPAEVTFAGYHQNCQFNLIMICQEEQFAENFKSLSQLFVLDPMLKDTTSVGHSGSPTAKMKDTARDMDPSSPCAKFERCSSKNKGSRSM